MSGPNVVVDSNVFVSARNRHEWGVPILPEIADRALGRKQSNLPTKTPDQAIGTPNPERGGAPRGRETPHGIRTREPLLHGGPPAPVPVPRVSSFAIPK